MRSALLAAIAASGLALAMPAYADAPVDVLALTASSTDGMLMDAVDGDPTTAWQAKPGVQSAWLAVRFAKPIRLRALRVQTGAMVAGETVDVETSPDGIAYQSALKDQHLDADRMVDWALPKKPTALYVRLVFHYNGSGAPPRFQVEEFEAHAG